MGSFGLLQVSGWGAVLAGVLCLISATVYHASEISTRHAELLNAPVVEAHTEQEKLEQKIEETGLELRLLNENRVTAQVTTWLLLFAFLLAMFVPLGLYHVLSEAGSYLWMAVFAWMIGTLCLAFLHITYLATSWELAPAYVAASDEWKPAIAIVFSAFARVGDLARVVGNFLVWGAAVGMFSLAMMTTDRLPKWIGLLGLLAALTGGFLGMAIPFTDLVGRFGSLGRVVGLGEYAAQLWLLLTGVAILRLPVDEE